MILGECEIALAGHRARALVPAGEILPPDEDAREADHAAFGVIRRRARRLQRRVEDMLRVARSESGTIELHFRPVTLQAVCASAVEAFEGATKRKDLVISIADADGRDLVVDGDFEWLRQIVEGMIDNALRYATGATRIVLRVARQEEAALLAVSDDGPGWGVADPQGLLERFARRGENDGRRGTIETISGHGIGLSLVSWVVDKHGGRVKLDTAGAPLGGAEIAITLPLAKPS